MKTSIALVILALLALACTPNAPTVPPRPANPSIILATTTSTQDSGLLDVLVPDFEKKTGYTVKVIAVGTGAALVMGEKGDADVLLVHAPAAEEKLVQSGDAVDRRLVMHNDFILVGPKNDPAQVKGVAKIADVFAKIAQAKSLFVSRGDNSGTHQKELEIWTAAGLKPEGSWYQQTGQGMGATLKIASEKGAYTLTDRATYLAAKAGLSLDILAEGDTNLYNIYHVMVVNPQKHPKVNSVGGTDFADYLVAAETQKTIGQFGKDKFGQPLFFPDAR